MFCTCPLWGPVLHMGAVFLRSLAEIDARHTQQAG